MTRHLYSGLMQKDLIWHHQKKVLTTRTTFLMVQNHRNKCMAHLPRLQGYSSW